MSICEERIRGRLHQAGVNYRRAAGTPRRSAVAMALSSVFLVACGGGGSGADDVVTAFEDAADQVETLVDEEIADIDASLSMGDSDTSPTTPITPSEGSPTSEGGSIAGSATASGAGGQFGVPILPPALLSSESGDTRLAISASSERFGLNEARQTLSAVRLLLQQLSLDISYYDQLIDDVRNYCAATPVNQVCRVPAATFSFVFTDAYVDALAEQLAFQQQITEDVLAEIGGLDEDADDIFGIFDEDELDELRGLTIPLPDLTLARSSGSSGEYRLAVSGSPLVVAWSLDLRDIRIMIEDADENPSTDDSVNVSARRDESGRVINYLIGRSEVDVSEVMFDITPVNDANNTLAVTIESRMTDARGHSSDVDVSLRAGNAGGGLLSSIRTTVDGGTEIHRARQYFGAQGNVLLSDFCTTADGSDCDDPGAWRRDVSTLAEEIGPHEVRVNGLGVDVAAFVVVPAGTDTSRPGFDVLCRGFNVELTGSQANALCQAQVEALGAVDVHAEEFGGNGLVYRRLPATSLVNFSG